MPTRKISSLVATSAAAAVLLAGCGASGATPPPQPPPDPLHGAPKVQHPITDTAKFEQDPCALLTQQQLDELHVSGSGDPDMSHKDTPSCDWGHLSDPGGSFSVKFMKPGDGLSFLYQSKDTYGTFRTYPPIEGHPAVTAMSTGGGPPEQEGMCDISVGITDQRFIDVSVDQDKSNKSIDSSDPCGRAKSVATDVMQTLKKG